MDVIVELQNGKTERRSYPDDLFLQIGDMVEENIRVVEIEYPDDMDDDLLALELI